jgi:hypothetical protein
MVCAKKGKKRILRRMKSMCSLGIPGLTGFPFDFFARTPETSSLP